MALVAEFPGSLLKQGRACIAPRYECGLRKQRLPSDRPILPWGGHYSSGRRRRNVQWLSVDDLEQTARGPGCSTDPSSTLWQARFLAILERWHGTPPSCDGNSDFLYRFAQPSKHHGLRAGQAACHTSALVLA